MVDQTKVFVERVDRVSGAAAKLVSAMNKAVGEFDVLAAEARRIKAEAKRRGVSTNQVQMDEAAALFRRTGLSTTPQDLEAIKKRLIPLEQLDKAIAIGARRDKVALTKIAKRGPEGVLGSLSSRQDQFRRLFGEKSMPFNPNSPAGRSIEEDFQRAIQRNAALTSFDPGEVLEEAMREQGFFLRMERNTPSGINFDPVIDTFRGVSGAQELRGGAGVDLLGARTGPRGFQILQFAGGNLPFGLSSGQTMRDIVRGQGIIPEDQRGEDSGIGQQFDEFSFQGKEFQEIFGDINVLGQEFETIFSSAFDRLIAGGMEFDDVLKQLAIDLGKLILQKALFGGEGGGDGIVGAAIGGILSGIGGAFGGASGPTASQASFSAAFGTGFMAFAAGGPIRARQLALVGERGPELFVPGTSGSIIPNGRFGVSTGSSMIIENIDARGADAQAVARLESILKELDARVDRVDRSVEPRVAGFMADRFIRRGTAKRVLKR